MREQTLPAEVRRALFTALDRCGPEELVNPKSMRLYLYEVALRHEQALAEALDGYIDLLLEEYCAGADGPAAA